MFLFIIHGVGGFLHVKPHISAQLNQNGIRQDSLLYLKHTGFKKQQQQNMPQNNISKYSPGKDNQVVISGTVLLFAPGLLLACVRPVLFRCNGKD